MFRQWFCKPDRRKPVLESISPKDNLAAAQMLIESVRDRDHCAVGCCAAKGGKDLLLGIGIEICRNFIQKENPRLGCDCAGNRE